MRLNAQTQTAVKAELDSMLAAPYFSQSNRCKKFLSHIVLQTLSGNANQLKERIIGISVFDRANDYDTGEDAIVRVTANEVRKRIGQFYQESRGIHPIQIDLPRGAYVPDFRIHLLSQGSESVEATALEAAVRESAEGEPPLPVDSHAASAAVSEQTAAGQPETTKAEAPQGHGARKRWFSIAIVLLILVTAVFLGGLWKSTARNRVPHLWDAFIQTKTPVLVCLGTHNIPEVHAPSGEETEDVVVRRETIPIDDATVVTSMARILGDKGIPFRLVAADQTSITDLQMQPVILIGAVDNKWTLQLTQALRYRVFVDYPSGSGQPPIASIVDAEHPSGPPWKIDFSLPLSEWKNDYAIVAREDDATIGVPVVIEAGLGNTGSLAASEFLTSGALPSALKNDPSCSGKSNFEAVIGTDIIGTRPGPPHLIRLTCW